MLFGYRIIRDNLAGGNRSTRERLMTSCLFTDPQVAQVGLTETAAQKLGISVQVVKVPVSTVLRTRTLSEMEGFLKALIAADGRIFGFSMIGPEAGEVMSVVQMAMQDGLPYTAVRDSVLAHPTMAEGLNGFFSAVKPAQATPNTSSLPDGRQ
jgi:pyruvate/2-oxoglutarate dehydrogenase complex dihydrolipoamide dehydrogenase (E3) component